MQNYKTCNGCFPPLLPLGDPRLHYHTLQLVGPGNQTRVVIVVEMIGEKLPLLMSFVGLVGKSIDC